MKLLLALAIALPLLGENYHAGSASVPGYAPDTAICNGSMQPVAGQSGLYATIRYGSAIACDISEPNGKCSVKALTIEPRQPGPNTSTQIQFAARVFTVSANGVTSMPLDIYALAGSLVPYSVTLANVPVTDGHLRITLAASKGNAILAGLEIACTAAPVPPFTQNPDGSWNFTGNLHVLGSVGVSGLVSSGENSKTPSAITLTLPDGSSVAGASGTFSIGNCSVVMQAGVIVSVTCTPPKAALICKTGNCNGMYYVETPSAKLLGVPAPANFTPSASWVPAK